MDCDYFNLLILINNYKIFSFPKKENLSLVNRTVFIVKIVLNDNNLN